MGFHDGRSLDYNPHSIAGRVPRAQITQEVVMFVGHTFTLPNGNKSPWFGVGDIRRWRELFPENPIWKSNQRNGSLGNKFYPTQEEARLFYEALVSWKNSIRLVEDEYQTGNFTGSIAVVSDLESASERLIEFFEAQGFVIGP